MKYDFTKIIERHGKDAIAIEQIGSGVAWQDGRMFHGKYAIRINLALPFSLVEEAFERMDKYVFNAE